MSSTRPSLEPLHGDGDFAPSPADEDRAAYEAASNWPLTRLVSAGLLVALGLSTAGPDLVAGDHGARSLALVLPAIVAAVSGRTLFGALGTAGRRPGLRGHLGAALLSALVASALTTGCALVVGLPFAPAALLATFLLAAGVLVSAGLARDLEVRVRLALRRVFFVGSAEGRRDLERELRRRKDASFVGYSPATAAADPELVIGAVRGSRATVLVLDGEAMRNPMLVEAASRLNIAGMYVRDLVGYYEAEFKKVPLAELSPTWFLFDIAPIHHRGFGKAVRRVLEVTLAGGVLVLSSPVMLAAAIAIRLTSPGPILYRQRRVGRGGEVFTLLKLRTMREEDPGGAAWAPSQEHRITAVGRVLRRYRIDELPQLLNVIRGDLALIGPRPEQVPIAKRLESEIPYYSARHCVRPGLTGWAQVNLGYAGSVEGTVAKLQRDLYYIKHSSLRLDALIVWLTLRTVISGRG